MGLSAGMDAGLVLIDRREQKRTNPPPPSPPTHTAQNPCSPLTELMSTAGMAQIRAALHRGGLVQEQKGIAGIISHLFSSMSKPMPQVTALVKKRRKSQHGKDEGRVHVLIICDSRDLFSEAALGKHSSLSPVISTTPPNLRGQGAPSLQQCRAAMQAAGLDAAAPKLGSLHSTNERCCSHTVSPYGKSQG